MSFPLSVSDIMLPVSDYCIWKQASLNVILYPKLITTLPFKINPWAYKKTHCLINFFRGLGPH